MEVKRAIPRSRLPAGTPTASINAGTYKTPAAAGNAAISSTTATSNAAHSAKAGANAAGPGSSSTTATGSSNKSAASGTSRKAYSAAASGESSGASALASGPTTAPVTQPLTAPALTPATSSRTVAASTSYAAALKGASGAGSDSSSSGNILSATIPHRDPAAPHIGNSGMNLLLAVQRPSRSNSESVGGGKFEGSSALNGDSLPLDSPMLSSRNANAGTISNASSRSNSIVQAPSGSLVLGTVGYSPESSNHGKSPVTLGNLPWLSSPPSNPLDPTGAEFGLPSLPPASDHHRQPGANSTESHHSGNRSLSSGLSFSTGSNQGMHGSNGLWFPSPQMTMGDPQQQQQAQQYMGGPFGGGMMFNPYMAMGAPPGMAPSPEAWTAMIEQHQQQQHAGLMNGQFPPPYIVPTAFPPFYSPDGYGSAAGGPSATPQQQQQHMMYLAYHHHQMMQYQNHMAMVHQAQMQQQALGGGSSGNSTGGSAGASATPAGADQQQKNFSNTFNSGNLGNGDGTIPGVGAALASAAAAGGKSSEQTESDDLFNHFNELTLDSATFDPMSTQPWASRR